MSSISAISSGVSNAATGWDAMRAQRAQTQAKVFAKIDSDGSGGIDKTELKSALNTIAKKTGTANSQTVDQIFGKVDSNGDGSISSDELGKGLKNLLPPPSTVNFAQSRGTSSAPNDTASANNNPIDKLFSKVDSNGDGSLDKSELKTLADKIKSDTGVDVSAKLNKLADDNGGQVSKQVFEDAVAKAGPPSGGSNGAGGPGGPGGAGGPPPGGPPRGGGGGKAGGTEAASSTTTYDPLDTNQDGTVSETERAAGTAKADALKALLGQIDSNGDKKISKSEVKDFINQLSSQLQSTNSASSTANATSTAQTASSALSFTSSPTSLSSTTSDNPSRNDPGNRSGNSNRPDIGNIVKQMYTQFASSFASSQGNALSALA